MIMTGTAARPVSWRDRLAIVAGIGAIPIAIWLLPASVHIVRWDANGPGRVALFGPPSLLAVAAAGAALTVAVLLAWTSRDAGRAAGVAARVAPFSLLWLWAIPFLRWLPDRLPLLLVLSGPLRWAIVAFAIAGSVDLPARLAALSRAIPAPGRVFVFAVSFVAYVAFGFQATNLNGPGGDEPHYLIISQSLLADGDLLIDNNHRLKQYRSFYGGELKPDFMTPGRDGRIYSIHAPGLPVVLLPAYALAGYPGALVTMCLLAALTAVAVFDLARAFAGRAAASLAWLATCFTVPFLPTAWMIYPEIAGALVVGWAALWVWRPQPERAGMWLWRGLALASLPWLHTKFIVFTAMFALALAVQARRHFRSIVALAAPIALSTAAWLWSFYVMWGSPNPEAPYGDYAQLHVLVRNIPRSLLGLLFDQKFGLLFYSPIYVLTLAGWWRMVRRAETRYLALVLVAVTAAFTASTARLYMWWGGSSAPARFLVPVIPCLAPMIAAAIAEWRSRAARALIAPWLVVSVGIALAAVALPEQRIFFSDPHGSARLLEATQASAPLTSTYPTFTTEDWRTPLGELLPWVVAALVAMTAVTIAARRWRSRSVLWLSGFGAIAFLLAAAVATARPSSAVRDDTARRGALDVVWDWNPARRGFDYGENRSIDNARLQQLSVIALPGPPGEPLALPAGAYDARVWFAGAGAREGTIAVTSQRAVFGRYAGALQNPTVVPFELPASLDRVSVTVRDPALAQQIVSTDIVPRDVVPTSIRDTHRVRFIEPVAGSSSGFVVYFDPATFPEGGVFWTRGTDTAQVLIAPGGASGLVMTLHLGPMAGDVRVDVAGRESTVHVPANDTVDLEAPLPVGARLVPVTITSPTQFRPNRLDPQSDDSRRLGCQVRVVLKR